MGVGALSGARLARLREMMAGHVAAGGVSGVVWLVSRRGEVHVDAVGTMALGSGVPVRRDTVFRVSSLTKPVAAAAAMTLVEEGRLRLDDPVDDLLPELAGRRVLRTPDGPLRETSPADRPISLRDLLTLRMGFGSVFDGSPLAVAAEPLNSFGPPKPAPPYPPDEWMRRLGELPLMCQPGSRWLYATGSHVLGVLLARACGQPLDEVLRERVFGPLDMRDTGFVVDASTLDRLPVCYADGGEVLDDPADSQWSRPPVFPDAAGGLVSTVDDCLAFGRMMLGGGRVGRTRVLSRPSVEVMTTDHLSAEQAADASWFLGAGRGWGFGLSVFTARIDAAAVPGRYGWDGGLGTSWYNDPRESMIGIVMTQRLTSPTSPPVADDFWTGVYASIDD